ncbi:hypothetical protein EYF80_056596 [Liparis tanakae]|uniref:Uncharacterized protein n=1 Tax=Liparis tanakae TaxID=230148 RepID=A0A4Z2EWF5_9TELE|nr:hypothetical protein EYF80_056596 [Liparis tanakae]
MSLCLGRMVSSLHVALLSFTISQKDMSLTETLHQRLQHRSILLLSRQEPANGTCDFEPEAQPPT